MVSIYVLDNQTWTKPIVHGNGPRTLCNTVNKIGPVVYIFGGIQDGNVNNDPHMYNIDNLLWTVLSASGKVLHTDKVCSTK